MSSRPAPAPLLPSLAVAVGLLITAVGIWLAIVTGVPFASAFIVVGAVVAVAGAVGALRIRARKQRAANVAEFQSILRSSWTREVPDDEK